MLSDSPQKRFAMDDTGIASSFKFINKLYELVEDLKITPMKIHEDLNEIDELKIIINDVSDNMNPFSLINRLQNMSL